MPAPLQPADRTGSLGPDRIKGGASEGAGPPEQAGERVNPPDKEQRQGEKNRSSLPR